LGKVIGNRWVGEIIIGVVECREVLFVATALNSNAIVRIRTLSNWRMAFTALVQQFLYGTLVEIEV
jgi:hypothetical protein